MAQQREVEINGVKTQTSALQELRDSITDCSDGMRSMQDEQLNTLQGSITILNSAWEGLMLTFAESNGPIKTVVDSLTDLLTAWTKWRKRNQGGDDAISTFELGVTDEQKKALNDQIAAQRAAGKTDEELIKGSEKKIEDYKKEEEELQRIYDLWLKRKKLIKSGKSGLANGKEFDELRQRGLDNTLKTGDKLASQIAAKRDQISQHQYIISVLKPEDPTTTTGGEDERRV